MPESRISEVVKKITYFGKNSFAKLFYMIPKSNSI